MSEYRPYPTEDLPPEDPDAEVSGEHEEVDDLSESGGEGRPARPAPNTEHPGGHLQGTVARLNRPRRFGFLRVSEGVEVFFHASALDSGPQAFDTLRTGQEVEFQCHQDDGGRGLAASVVTVTCAPPEAPVRAPRPPRAERPERPERPERVERQAAARPARATSQSGWHVAVLRDRYDMAVPAQLERLLNERHIRPGNFTLAVKEAADGTAECWVVYHLGD